MFIREIEALRGVIRQETATRPVAPALVRRVNGSRADLLLAGANTLLRGVPVPEGTVAGETVEVIWRGNQPTVIGSGRAASASGVTVGGSATLPPATTNNLVYHNQLAGLGGDDHPHYLTSARGDLRYAPTAHAHSAYAPAADLTAHLGNLSNPHQVTAAQTGAVMKAGDTMTGSLAIQGSANAVQLLVRGHSTQTANVQEWRDGAGATGPYVDSRLRLRGGKEHWLPNGFVVPTAPQALDLALTGMWDRNELTQAALRGVVTVTVTGAGAPLQGTVAYANNLFDAVSGSLFEIAPVDATTTKVVIHVDLLASQPNYLAARWQPFVQYRWVMNGDASYFRKITVEVSADNAIWHRPSNGAWETLDAAANQIVPGLWIGANEVPNSPSTLSFWRYVRFTLEDLWQNANYTSKHRLWLSEIGLRHIGAPWARQYARTDGADFYGGVRVMTTGTANAYHSLAQAGLGFFGAAPAPRPAAYTLAGTATRTLPTLPPDFSGLASGQAGTPYAAAADLNTLKARVAELEGVVRQLIADHAAYGLLQSI
jgi:hypothetical protein